MHVIVGLMDENQNFAYRTGYAWAGDARPLKELKAGAKQVIPSGTMKYFEKGWKAGRAGEPPIELEELEEPEPTELEEPEPTELEEPEEHIEYLNRMPPDKNLGLRGDHWSSWQGKLAIVISDLQWFDPATLQSTYIVRYAVDLHTRQPIQANVHWLGQHIVVDQPSLPYEETVFTTGTGWDADHPKIKGTFASLITYKVYNTLKTLSLPEQRLLVQYLNSRNYLDVSGQIKPDTAKMWRQLLGQPFTAIQETSAWELANQVERFVSLELHADTMDDVAADEAWASIPGVYSLTKKDEKIKYVVGWGIPFG